jgi:hypothetical protein
MKKRAKRDKPLFIKATPEEHKLFSDLAQKRHTTVSEMVRQLLHREVALSQGQGA